LVAFSRLPLSLFLSCHFALSLPLLSCDLWPLQFKGFAEQRWRERKGGRKGKVVGKERWQERKGGKKGKGDRRGKVTGEFSHCFSSQHG
jgi:hypothetical protein